MSYTKSLKKRLPRMSIAEMDYIRNDLASELSVTKNPMARASLKERIRLIETRLELIRTTNPIEPART